MPEPYQLPFAALVYDAQFEGMPALRGDAEFYVRLAREAGGKVLEAGCGTGRVLLPTLRAGADAVGLDASPHMLGVLRRKAKAEGLEVELHEGDLRTFSLPHRFALVTAPFRVFQHLLGVEDQKAALTRIREHLLPGGRLAFNVFHPNHEFLVRWAGEPQLVREVTHPETGNRLLVWHATSFDIVGQLVFAAQRYEELDDEGRVLSVRHHAFRLRYFHRFELEHLAALCGLEVESLHGDFEGGPLEHGGEMVFVLRRPE